MSGHEQPGLIDRLVGVCLKVLGAAIALYVAVYLVQSVLPFVLMVIGCAALCWLGIVVYKTWRERW
ncbi:hypothetical protein IU459_15670 [Nocardia amamiensis]|uniref:Uncharacterized protein n=1 Tax=Nocardia amamiensis TaxID=404578 RepID=A0ABS0CQV9_9NOCA|nr:hypothetical protein [Nocardia amamiensis]MBF6298971.1 hypothetical protein [Nocardia amamiensis]